MAEGYFNSKKIEIKDVHNRRNAMISVLIFILATAFIVFFGSFDGMRPTFLIDGETVTLGMSAIIEIVMLSAAALILLITKTDGIKATQGSVFSGWDAGGNRHLRHCLDGRYIPAMATWRNSTASIEGTRPPDAVAVRHRPVRHVHPAVQPGCHGTRTECRWALLWAFRRIC